jgi:N-acetylglucosaminyl-diphospho-decaprenol L-rhamnosyltransferase
MDPATLPAASAGHNGNECDGAVVVVNYRTPALVEQCLTSVRATCGELRLQMVVVDNASRDGSVEQLRAALPDATVLALEENRGFAAGVNAGFRHTSAELVVVLNPDTELRGEALGELLEHLRRNPRTGVVAPLLEDADGQLAPNGYRRFPGPLTVGLDLCVPLAYLLVHARAANPYALSPAALRRGRSPAWVCGAVMAIRRTAYAQAGPLDEDFFLYFEETEWQQRVTRAGWRIELASGARARHLVRGGGEDALAPSPYFLTSALRYLQMQGVPRLASRAIFSLALATSWLTLRLIALLPAKRATATGQARAYGALLRGGLTGARAPR